MQKIGLLQPGRLGDIIICLPIAKHFYDRGHKVIWPIFHNYINDVTEVIDYVNFVPVTDNIYECVKEANQVFSCFKNIKVLDIAATFPGSTCTEEYVKLGDGLGNTTFDQYKYQKSDVPFEEKWNFAFNRINELEDIVYQNTVTKPNYNIISTTHSRGKINIQFESKYTNIEINQNYNFFSWYKVLESAKNIVLVDSAMANFVEQTNLPNKKILITKPGQPRPYFKNNWIVRNV